MNTLEKVGYRKEEAQEVWQAMGVLAKYEIMVGWPNLLFHWIKLEHFIIKIFDL